MVDLPDNDDKRGSSTRRPETAGGDAQAEEREAQADAREQAADRRDLANDTRELVLDRWEREISAVAAALNLLEAIDEDRHEQGRLERLIARQIRREAAEARRDAAIARELRRYDQAHPDRALLPRPPAGLPPSFAPLGSALRDGSPLGEMLNAVVEAAPGAIAGCAAATVVLRTGGRFETAAATAPWATALDRAQLALGAGPLLEARHRGQVFTADLARDQRWPALAEVAEARDRAAMAFGLEVTGDEAGTLTLYAEPGEPLDATAAATGDFLAAHAVAALRRSFERLTHEAQGQAWRNALASRDAIGQAKGILMAQRSISAEEAFDVLREASQRLNRKIRDISVEVVEHGALPDA